MNICDTLNMIVYAPDFFRELAGTAVPEEAFFFEPGLGTQDTNAQTARLFTPADLPLSKKEARLSLQELLDYGTNHAHALQVPGTADFGNASGIRSVSRAEDRALKTFAATGSAPQAAFAPDAATQERSRRVEAQKMLLMGYSLEQSILEATSLLNAAKKANAALARSLGSSELPFDLDGVADMPRPDWSRILGAMLVFLPENAAVYTGHAQMLAWLRESAFVCTPLAEEQSLRLFPQSAHKGWKFASATVDRKPFSGQDGTFCLLLPLEQGA